ncbi:LuxR C-terminal-related transcriptional regulator [Candidatus Microgenomates bacterium]|nr:LuxR C-terminal-related transcriptional regulator [Candidatus Microgenomates bacterium]
MNEFLTREENNLQPELKVHVNFTTDLLSPAEERVTRLYMNGLSVREVSQTLGKSVNTIRRHISSSYNKIGLVNNGYKPANIIEAMYIMAEKDLVELTLESNVSPDQVSHVLSYRQFEVTLYQSKGLLRKETAEKLLIEPTTVKKHDRDMLKKFKKRNIDLRGKRLKKLLALDAFDEITLPFIKSRINPKQVLKTKRSPQLKENTN